MKTPFNARLLRSTTGASMVEYGFLTAAVVLGSIGVVLVFGENVRSYYEGTVIALDDPTAGNTEGITFVQGPPTPQISDPSDACGFLASGGEFRYGTDLPDVISLTSDFAGAFGGSGFDIISGNNVGYKFSGGPGNDILSSGSGNDIYCFEPGDGDDVVTDTAGINTISMPTVSYADVSATLFDTSGSGRGDLVLSYPNGSVRIVEHFGLFESTQFSQAIFSDLIIPSRQEFRSAVVDMQKVNGIVYGTAFIDNHTYEVGVDGSYVIVDDKISGTRARDNITIRGAMPEDVSFVHTPDYHLEMTIGADTLRFHEQNHINLMDGMDNFIFEDAGVTLTAETVRSLAVDNMKASGTVIATRFNEDIFHDGLNDPSYVIFNDHYLKGPREIFRLVNSLPSNTSFAISDGFEFGSTAGISDDFIITFQNGSTMRIDAQEQSNQNDGASGFIFEGDPDTTADDVVMSIADARVKALEDMKSTGRVVGSTFADHFTYLPTDITPMSVSAGYGSQSHIDVLDLSSYQSATTTFARGGNSSLVLTFDTGQVLMVRHQFANLNHGFESVVFADGTFTRAEISAMTP